MAKPALMHPRRTALAAILAALCFASSSGVAAEAAFSPVPQSLLIRYLADNSTFTLLDARTSREYASSHIAGAINVPHDEVSLGDAGLPADLDQPIVVYCGTGLRATALKARLTGHGYKNVRTLKPEQIVWFDGMAVFNCGAPPARTLETRIERTTPVRAKEEES